MESKELRRVKDGKAFVPHELKTIEVDVEKKIFRINGEDFGSGCTGFSIHCEASRKDDFYLIYMNVEGTTRFLSFDKNGRGTDSQ